MTRTSLPPNPGVAARQWRRQLAATAKRSDDTIRTIKFPLDIDYASASWEAVSLLHQTIASDAPGSLIRFLYTILLANFRVFGKQSEAEAFRNSAILNDVEWRETVLSKSSLTLAIDSFVPSRIYQRLLIAPRAVGGKDSSFKAEIISNEYAKFFCGKYGDQLPEPERMLFSAIGDTMSLAFSEWKQLTSSPAVSAGIIDGVLDRLGYARSPQTLSMRISPLRPSEGTVVFDDKALIPTDDTASIEPNLIVSMALRTAQQQGLSSKPEVTKFAQAYFTGDANHSGLAWLFGKGFEYFRSTSLRKVMLDFDIPADRSDAVAAVLEAACTIPPASNTFFGGKNYAAYRSGIGGVLGSWVANYISRLFDLEKLLSEPIDPIVLPPSLLADKQLFSEASVTPDEIVMLAQRAVDERILAYQSLSRLIGRGDELATRKDIDAIEEYNMLLDTLAGTLSSISEVVEKATERADDTQDDTVKKILADYKFTLPKWVRRMEKINRLNLSPVTPERDLAQAADEFDLLRDAMFVHYESVKKWAESVGETMSPLTRLAAKEGTYFQQGAKKRNPEEQAARTCFSMIGRAARKCADKTRNQIVSFFIEQKIFAEAKNCSLYFFNHKGTLYKSPYDRGPRQPFAITRSSVDRAEMILVEYSDFLFKLRQEVMSESPLSLRRVTDLFSLEQNYFAMLLIGFPDAIPVHLALHDAVAQVFNLPLPILLRLQGDKVTSSIMRRVFNNYYVRLKSLAAVLLRDNFYLCATIQRTGDADLVYVAPDDGRLWAAPERLYKSARPIGAAMRRLQNAPAGIVSGKINPSAALPFMLSEESDQNALRAYLRQAPHDWYFPWPASPSINGLFISKTGIGKRLRREAAARLVGASAYKGILDTALVSPESVETGDAVIIFEQYFDQSCHFDTNGHLIVEIKKNEASVKLALPVKEAKSEGDETHEHFPRYVAIDIGERGLGFAVFDAKTDALIEKGRVPVHSMRRLVMDDRSGKRKKSQANRFRSGYDPAEERRRGNVVGDFCNAINRLMWYYEAFPVFESDPGGAKSQAINKVYALVVHRYLYSTTQSIDAERKSYWAGASYWKHSWRMKYKFDKTAGKKSDVVEPLSLFPGTGVSAYGTSQTCSHCHRNPAETVKEMKTAKGNKQTLFRVRAGGYVDLPNGTIQLFFSAPETERTGFRRRNENTPLSKPADPETLTESELLGVIRRNLRRAPRSKQARDTSVSQYHCIYEDCRHVIHADENAAINIGHRFAAIAPK